MFDVHHVLPSLHCPELEPVASPDEHYPNALARTPSPSASLGCFHGAPAYEKSPHHAGFFRSSLLDVQCSVFTPSQEYFLLQFRSKAMGTIFIQGGPNMKRMIFSVLLAAFVAVALVAVPSHSVQAGGEGWLDDWEKAKKQAKEEDKDILIDFTGSDW
jgi:hypothetical protein